MGTVTPASAGMVPPVVAPAPILAMTSPWLASRTNEPVSSPVASVLLTPSILSEPGTYVETGPDRVHELGVDRVVEPVVLHWDRVFEQVAGFGGAAVGAATVLLTASSDRDSSWRS